MKNAEDQVKTTTERHNKIVAAKDTLRDKAKGKTETMVINYTREINKYREWHGLSLGRVRDFEMARDTDSMQIRQNRLNKCRLPLNPRDDTAEEKEARIQLMEELEELSKDAPKPALPTDYTPSTEAMVRAETGDHNVYVQANSGVVRKVNHEYLEMDMDRAFDISTPVRPPLPFQPPPPP